MITDRMMAVIFLLALAAPVAFAARIFVEPATGSGVSDADLQTATELVRTAVPESNQELVDEAGSAEFTLRPRLLKLGSSYVLSLEKRDHGKSVFSSSLKAAQFEEIDKVARRLTRSVLQGEQAGDHPTVGQITEQEAHDGTQRKPVRHSWFLGFGGATLGRLNSSGIGISLEAASAWDFNVMMVKLLGDFSVRGDALFGNAGLGALVFLTSQNIAPFLCADFGYGFTKIDGGGLFDGQTSSGFVLGAGTGVQFMRASAINLELALRVGFLLANNNLGSPTVGSLRLGVYF